MAQFLHDGGHQALPFQSYPRQWLASSASHGGAAEGFHQQPTILDPNDNAFMESFFSNPDAAMMGDFSVEWPSMDQKPSRVAMRGQLDGFDGDSNIIHEPATTLAENPALNYHNQQNGHDATMTHHSTFPADEHEHSSVDDVQAASRLFTMSMRGQDHARGAGPAVVFDPEVGGSWGSFGLPGFTTSQLQDHLQSPLTSSGRQSANSYQSQPHLAFSANHYSSASAAHQQQQLMQHYWFQEQQRHVQPHARSRDGSLQLDTSSASFFPAPQMQVVSPAGAFDHNTTSSTTRPSAVRFGSDSDFGSFGYRGPSSQVPLEHEKGANLNNVPFAAQAAANGQTTNTPSLTAVTQQHAYQQYSLPGHHHNMQNTSTASSPATMGGLPLHSPIPGYQRHSHPFHQMPRPQIRDEVEVEEDEEEQLAENTDVEDAKPIKRRKSRVMLEDEADYLPPGHMQLPTPKRGAMHTSSANMNGSDDGLEETFNPPAKRRRSSYAGMRPSFASSETSSPPAFASSPADRTASSSKKKSRHAQSRPNLTEDQKRKNHIQSEKHRRDLIRTQYDELDRMVPALKVGKSGLSRSDVLKEIVMYVESVGAGNDSIEEILKRRAPTSPVPAPASPPAASDDGDG